MRFAREVGELLDAIKDKFDGGAEGLLGDAGDALKGAVDGAGDTVADAFGNVGESIDKAVGGAVDNAGDAVASAFGNAGNVLGDSFEGSIYVLNFKTTYSYRHARRSWRYGQRH